jgi:subtilisin family serine protease/C-terminal processing protease CtpA/Prc
VLDDNPAGAPFIPQGSGAIGGGTTEAMAPPPESLLVEVELTANASSIGAVLAADASAFASGSTAGARADTALAEVLRQFQVIDAHQVFTPEQNQADEARLAFVRQAVMMGEASQERASALERLSPLSNFVRLRFPAETSATAVTAALSRVPDVARAVVVPKAMPPMLAFNAPAPADPLIGSGLLIVDDATGLESQWYLHRTRVPQAWRYTRGAGVVVADIDWGFRTSHQDFGSGFEQTYNAVDGSANVTHGASAGHGTAVMGIAAARTNGVGIAGYAPEASLWGIQGDSGTGIPIFQEPWAEAIDFVRRQPDARRKVIILEVQTGQGGNYEQVPSVARAIRAAIADGCVVCVAAGNGNRAADRTDAGDPFDPTGSILVGATAYDPVLNKRAWFSNFGSRVSMSAPGDSSHDLTCANESDSAYRNGFGGTSGATPKVAGTVALMLSVNPALTHDDARDILVGTGASLVEDPGKPIGMFLNAEAAVAEALRRRSESTPATALLTPQGEPAPEPPPTTRLEGVRRRVGQMSLPRDTGGPLSWNETDEAVAVAPAAMPELGQPPAGDKTLRLFRESVEGTLTQDDRILIVSQAIQMLDNFYVHRTLKEAVHAVRPIQRLRVLQRRLQTEGNIPSAERDELAFHNTLTQIFNSVRDLHTSYQLPRPYRDFIAYLPFEVAWFRENGRDRYLVTRVVPGYGFESSDFAPGAELLYWNGMAIGRAVRANADQTAGGNEAARHTRGVSALTIRPMNTALPPDADFVDLEFVPRDADPQDSSARRKMRQDWFVRFAPSTSAPAELTSSAPVAPAMVPANMAVAAAARSSLDLGRHSTQRSLDMLYGLPGAGAPLAADSPPQVAAAAAQPVRIEAFSAVLGLDAAADSVREARQLIFDSASLKNLQAASIGDEADGIRGSSSAGSVEDTLDSEEIKVKVTWATAFRARTLGIDGKRFGHIHVRTFNSSDADGFVEEFVRLLRQIPDNGLIMDVRGNGGGNIWAAERLLQTLTARSIEPERMQFVSSAGTLDLARNNPATSSIPLNLWRPSLEEAVETGATYSRAFPLTSLDSCNAIGQQYYGPVVLVVDGNCYSATDMFAAGFQDHQVGKVLGVANATGAGGANVWPHSLLTQALPAGWGLKPLPNQAGMRVAIRQCLRVGPRAGALLEDFGVVPDKVQFPSRADLMLGDIELFKRAAELLAENGPRSIRIEIGAPQAGNTGRRALTVMTRGLKRLDFFINDRPEGSVTLTPDAAGNATLTPAIDINARFRLVGYAQVSDRDPAALCQGQVP